MNNGRPIIFEALVGSHNYCLNTETSDKDYKYFVAPTFDDLYDGRVFSSESISAKVDISVHDIRKLPNLLFKSNINFMECLFSSSFNVTSEPLKELFEIRDDIAKMNIPYLFAACKGMYYDKMSHLEKGTTGTKELVEKYGYDTKQAMHAYRCIDFIKRFADIDFSNFKKAIVYEGTDREFMLSIKDGKYSKEDFYTLISTKYNNVIGTYENVYHSVPTDTKTKDEVYDIVKEAVKEELDRQYQNKVYLEKIKEKETS